MPNALIFTAVAASKPRGERMWVKCIQGLRSRKSREGNNTETHIIMKSKQVNRVTAADKGRIHSLEPKQRSEKKKIKKIANYFLKTTRKLLKRPAIYYRDYISRPSYVLPSLLNFYFSRFPLPYIYIYFFLTSFVVVGFVRISVE